MTTKQVSGFLHVLSPKKKSSRGTVYYTFQVQTSPNSSEKVVGYNQARYGELSNLHSTHSPVKLILYEKDNTNIFNDSSSYQKMKPYDLDFGFNSDIAEIKNTSVDVESTVVTIDKLEEMSPGSYFTINDAYLSIGSDPLKSVKTKFGNASSSSIKEDCSLQDATGHISLHIWESTFKQLKDQSTYNFENVVLKSYQGEIYLSTTMKTKFTLVPNGFIPMESDITPDVRTVEISEFEMVMKVEIFHSCKNCKRKIPIINNSKMIKCNNCGACSRAKQTGKNASCSLEFEVDGESFTMTAFTDVIQTVLQWSQKDFKNANEVDIEVAFMELEAVEVDINTKKKKVLRIKQLKENVLSL